MKSFFEKYLLPGFVFQSVVIGGGYGTGRELAEFFLSHGPVGGLLAMVLVSTVIWSVVCAVSYEFTRTFKAYDYRHFFIELLGRWWFLFELTYLSMLLIVLAVIASAGATILHESFGVPYILGVIGMMGAVGFLVFRGSGTIEKVMASWSFVLYGVFVIFFALCFARFGDSILASLAAGEVRGNWFVGGIRYGAYNLGAIPAVLFALRHIENRREAVGAGLLTGPIAIIPGLLFYLAMVGQYPAVLERPVPANFLLELLGSPTFQLFFQIVLFGTLIETGTGMIHAVNERIAGVYEERSRTMPGSLRPAVAIGLLIVAAILARFGLIDLIAKGYGTITWFFLAIFVLPILTWGLWKLRRAANSASKG